MLVMLNARCAAWGLENEGMNDWGEKGVGGWLAVCLSVSGLQWGGGFDAGCAYCIGDCCVEPVGWERGFSCFF